MPIHLLPRASQAGTQHRLTRRGFLTTVALGGAAGAMNRPLFAGDEEPRGGWYALVADTHIAADRSARSRGEVMADNLRSVVAEILAQPERPRGLLIVGDLAFRDGQPGDYRLFVELIEPLRSAGVPIHLTLGNHDDRDHFQTALEPHDSAVVGKQVSLIDDPDVRFVLLDSLDRVNVTPGLVGKPQLRWLTDQLDAVPKKTAIVAVHHNLAHTSGALLDTEELLAELSPRRQVKAILFGHTHVWDVRDQDGLPMINLPASAYPFAHDQPLGWCRFQPGKAGAELSLHCTGGDRRHDGQRIDLHWRAA